ncbi:efflux RND transporter permease subunit [Gimibacter soli]|uniref:Efflux RND transporter permease subunit n=1 Tax=Gimibacter soli TaxID=3024400 RepID=A0AAF0BII0_9PROT|nr:efflux RND transporter permease subunit [Gimibacter soli]WCL55438.1 efflux RND transporter permease subunit [Gimibacter soli]
MRGSLYNHPRLVWLILLVIVIAGFNAYTHMPRLEDPHMQSRVVQVTTFYPGADTERVEAEVTEKLERKIFEIPEVKEVKSVTRAGISFISIELEDRVEDAKPITQRLKDKVAEVTDLPAGVTAPDFSDTRIYAHSAILALTWHSDTPVNYAILGRHAREIERKLRNLEGTDFVDVLGLPNEEIRVSFDPKALAAHGLTVAQVAARVAGSDAKGAAGIVSSDTNRMVVQVSGAIDNIARLARVSLGQDEKGAAVRLGDIARIERTFENPASTVAINEGSYGVVVAARMFEDSRIDRWSDAVGRMMAESEETLPASIKLERIFDQRLYADDRLNGLMANLAEGAFVVLAVLLVSLGWRASLVSASILPLTLLAALAIVNIMGLRIEQVLVTGMIVALGIMVDNAIVITDEIQHLRLMGVRRSTAVGITVRKLWLPLAGSTATTIIAFMPLILMPGNAGDFLVGIPAAVIASLIASYVIGFTIISAVAGRVVEGRDPNADMSAKPERVWWRDGVEGRWLSSRFEKSLRWSVKRPILSASLAMLIPMLGFVAATQVESQFFPISDRNQFRLQLQMPGQVSIEETEAAARKLDAFVRQYEGVESLHWYIGVRPGKFYYSVIASNDGVVSIAEAMVTLDDYDRLAEIMPRLQREAPALLPEAVVQVRELETGPPIQAPIEVRVIGPDLAVLQEYGDKVREIVSRLPKVTHTSATLKGSLPLVEIDAREDDVLVAGLTLSDVESQMAALTGGVIATHIIEETQQVPVRLIVDRGARTDINSVADMGLIGTMPQNTADGFREDLPVSAVANVRLNSKVGVIAHHDGERINEIQGFLEFNTIPDIAFNALKEELTAHPLQMPPGYRLEFGGESEERGEALGQLFATVGLLVILMVLTIVLTFNSFRLALVTFLAAVQAAGLGFFSLWFFGYPLTFVVIIGLMGLVGLAINAAIVILSELRNMPAARDGDGEAVVHGVMKTGRHIISTTLTTVGGFMPLILDGGAFWPPFAVAIVGGTFLSMIVSFYFAPAAFLVLARMRPYAAISIGNDGSGHTPVPEGAEAEAKS